MVQITRTLAIVASFAVSCLSATTVSSIVTDIGNMIEVGKQLEATFKNMNGYNWMVISPSLHSGVQSIASGMDQCSRDVMALGQPASAGDALAVLGAIEPLVNLSQQFMTTLTSAKSTLIALPVVGSSAVPVVQMELATIERSATNFANTMVHMAPASLASNASEMRTAIMSNLDSAIQAYATN